MQELPGALPPGAPLGFCPGPTAETFARRKRVNNYFFHFNDLWVADPAKVY